MWCLWSSRTVVDLAVIEYRSVKNWKKKGWVKRSKSYPVSENDRRIGGRIFKTIKGWQVIGRARNVFEQAKILMVENTILYNGKGRVRVDIYTTAL